MTTKDLYRREYFIAENTTAMSIQAFDFLSLFFFFFFASNHHYER